MKDVNPSLDAGKKRECYSEIKINVIPPSIALDHVRNGSRPIYYIHFSSSVSAIYVKNEFGNPSVIGSQKLIQKSCVQRR